jgi:hypothetical protein
MSGSILLLPLYLFMVWTVNGFTFLLTPCSRAPLDNMPVPQALQKFFKLYGTLRFITVFTIAV